MPKPTNRRAIRRAAAVQAAAAAPANDELTLDQAKTIIDVQKAQIETARRAFFKLAEFRAADLVKNENKSLEQAAEYRNAELAGLDQQLAALVPEELQEPQEG